MYKIPVMGDRESALGFMAFGFSVFIVTEEEEAAKTLENLAGCGQYAVIFITESVMVNIQDTVDQYKDNVIPAILPIPGREGALGLGMQGIKKSVERAVGADILFREEE